RPPRATLSPYTTLFRSSETQESSAPGADNVPRVTVWRRSAGRRPLPSRAPARLPWPRSSEPPMKLHTFFVNSIRYSTLASCTLVAIASGLWMLFFGWTWPLLVLCALAVFLTLVGIRDLYQTRHAILRNYP